MSSKAHDAGERIILCGSISTAVGFAIKLGARAAFLYVAGRLFGVLLYGAFSVATAVIELAVATGGLGMKRMLFKLLDERPQGRAAVHVVLDAALLVTIASLGIASFIMVVTRFLVPVSHVAATTEALFFLAPMIAGQALLDVLLAATRWKQKIRYEITARSIVEPYAGIVVAIVAYLLGFLALGLPISYWGGTLAALSYALIGVRRCYGSLHLSTYRVSPRSLPRAFQAAGAATLSDTINALFGRIDLYLVGAFLGESAAGLYGMARQGRTPVRQVRQSFDGLLTPMIARTLQLDGPFSAARATATAARLVLCIQLALLIALIAVGHQLLAWIRPEFVAGYVALLLLALGEAIQSALGLTDLILLYRRPAMTLTLTAIGIAINVAAGLLLMKWLGIEGAAAAVLIANIATAVLRRVMLHRGFGIRLPLRYNGVLFACAAAGSVGAILAVGALNPARSPLLCAVPLAIGLFIYAATLKAWLRMSPGALSLVGFRTE